MHTSFALIRIAVLAIIIPLMFVAQRFWFMRAWCVANKLGSPALRRVLHTVCVIVASLVALSLVFGFLLPRPGGARWFLLITRLWLSASFFAFLGVETVYLFEWLSGHRVAATTAGERNSLDASRRAFFRYAAYLGGGIPFVAAIYGFARERLDYRIQHVDVPLAGLPAALDGMRIVQLSDIHIGDFMPPDQVRRAVRMANEAGADLAVVTGDFITSSHDPLEECIAELSQLRAPLGTWGCNGNHEIYARKEQAAQQLFAQYGMRLLRQENAELGFRCQNFNLIGVDYQRERTLSGHRRPMLHNIEALVRKDIPNILLSHNPNSFYRAAQLGIQLSLAGHTHGGQIRVEIIDHDVDPARFITEFVAGLYRRPLGGAAAQGAEACLYVTRGLGTIGMPVRLGAPPEITVLTLRAL